MNILDHNKMIMNKYTCHYMYCVICLLVTCDQQLLLLLLILFVILLVKLISIGKLFQYIVIIAKGLNLYLWS